MFPAILVTLFFDTTSALEIMYRTLGLIGKWGVFKKCGTKPWYALIPCYEEFITAKCADREAEGKVIFGVGVLSRLFGIALMIYAQDELSLTLSFLGLVVMIPIAMVWAVYRIRVAVGLCRLFNKKRIWAVPMLVLEPIFMVYWGWKKNQEPQWQMIEVDDAVTEFFSGNKAEVLENGLTVNLEERTTKDLLSKKYLLRDIHMYIKPNSMVLLLGGSGAGKTTLLNAINGYEKAKAEVFLNGQNVYQDYKRMQYDIGFVPQQDLMRGSDTVRHTLSDSAALRLPSEFETYQRKERIDEVMDIFGLKSVADSMVSKLSGGQRKRLSIAMEYMNNPSLFILDEPDSGLDGVMARELMLRLRRIADQGKIIIVITHTPDRVIDLFDDVIVLAKDKNRTGRLAYYGSIEEAKEFFGRDSMERIVKSINRKEEGGEGRADEFIEKYAQREVAAVG